MLTMLGRLVIIDFGPAGGLPFVVAMWLPTTLMSFFISPHVLKNIALTRAVVETNHDVLEVTADWPPTCPHLDLQQASPSHHHHHPIPSSSPSHPPHPILIPSPPIPGR